MFNSLMLFERKDQVVVSSRVIAERFEKRHADVLAKLEGKQRSGRNDEAGLLEQLRGTGNPVDPYFICSSFVDSANGETYREYLCTRDGFVLLVMGFTGDKALAWKLKYIEAFNQMEAALRERQTSEWLVTRKQGKLVRRGETDALTLLIPYAEAQGSKNMAKQAYNIYSKLVNSLVGIDAGQRDSVPFKTLTTIAFLEDMVNHTVLEEMGRGVYYKEIYRKCKANGEQIMRFAYLPGMAA